jgi:hypothetical protein
MPSASTITGSAPVYVPARAAHRTGSTERSSRSRRRRGGLADARAGEYGAGDVRIEDVPDGYRAMNDREVLKFQINP